MRSGARAAFVALDVSDRGPIERDQLAELVASTPGLSAMRSPTVALHVVTGRSSEVEPEIVWAKFESLAAGSRLATRARLN